MKAIAVVRRLHRWIGLATGAVVAVASLTGALLVYGLEIEQALYPHLWEVSESAEPPLSVSALTEVIGALYPERRLTSLNMPGDPGEPVVAVVGREFRVFLHPRSGEILGQQVPSRTFFGRVETLHTELFAGPIGHTVVVWSTAVLVIMILLGLWLWWPQTRSKLKSSLWLSFRRGWKRANYDLHNVLGFYTALVLVFLAVTGVMLAYPGLTRSVGRIVFPGAAAQPPASSAPSEASQTRPDGIQAVYDPAMVDRAVAHAAEEYPEAHGTTVRFPPPRGGPLTVIKGMSAPSDPPEAHTLTYDPHTGELLTLTRYSEATSAQKANRLIGRIHLGTVYGWPTKLLAFVVSFIAGTLPISGAIVWYPRWRRKRRRKRARARQATPA